MKILIVRTFPGRLDPKAYNVQETGLAKALVRAGHSCGIVFYNGRSPSEEERMPEGYTVYRMQGRNFLKNGIMPGIDELCRDYDVVQVHEYDQIQSWRLYAGRSGIPAVIYHGPYYDAFNRGYNLKCAAFDRLYLPRGRKGWQNTPCLAKSPQAADFLRTKGFRNVVPVGVGLDTSPFGTEGTALRAPRGSGTVEILYAGKIEARRNTLFLAEVLKKVAAGSRDVHFTIVGKGEGKYAEEAGEALRPLEEKGVLTRRASVPQEEMGALYRSTDIFLFPSNYEIFGMVLLEAMYFGCAVVSSCNGGASTLIGDGGNGIVLKDFDAAVWAEQVLALAADPERRNAMSAAAQAEIREHFTWDALAPVFLETYREAAGGKAPDAGPSSPR
ncbi:MAG: glycosyltransferase family 4 protein [Lachnospiraceae bacterium]|jgi:glycosyltransferase involved in cell wall biosynthesis|nr:glycosyltransferase family 4 protein [Lachnospiraceae bacterium]